MLFDDTVGHEFLFYGVDNYMFKLDNHIWEVIEDPEDGYRSSLGPVEARHENDKKVNRIFFREPIAIVSVVEDSEVGTGYALIDCEIEHTWLKFGTDNTENYYPCFYFNYTPVERSKLPALKRQKDSSNVKLDELDLWFNSRDI